ncbi:MAG TPA: hypothetical protein VJL28_03520 [Gemmatimonadaceae bacterium]|nr:hypothetical protein [Gemmatimonadaceae bacterium]
MSWAHRVVVTDPSWVKGTLRETADHLERRLDEEARHGDWELLTTVNLIAEEDRDDVARPVRTSATALVFRRRT